MELDAILDNLSDEEQIELLELLEEEENYRNTHLLYEFTPYSKQREFIDAGHDYPERCFMAGNQLGKSFTGAAEVAFHLTGRYPGTKGYPADGKYGGEWKGKRFYEPVVFWIGGETNETVTKTTQRILCGRVEENDEPGYGSIPKEDIISWKKSPFFPNLVDHLLVKHHTPEGVEDGISICYFKPYSQGRARWQGDTIHGVWFDEEPPYSIYGEGLTRTNKYGQFSILTFTPLMGMSDVVTKFLKNPSKSQKVVNMTIYDAEHYTDEQKEQIIASYPEHERERVLAVFLRWVAVEYSRYRKRRLSASRLSVPITSMLSTLRTSAGTTRKLTFSFGGTKTQMFSIWRVYGRNQRTLPFRHGVLLSRGLTKYLSRGLMTVTNTKRAVVSNLKPNMRTPGSLCFLNTQRSRMAVTQ